MRHKDKKSRDAAQFTRLFAGFLLANILETLHNLAIAFDGLDEICQRPDPQAAFAVHGSVNDDFLFCLRIPGDANDFVAVAFEMAVNAKLNPDILWRCRMIVRLACLRVRLCSAKHSCRYGLSEKSRYRTRQARKGRHSDLPVTLCCLLIYSVSP